LQTIGIEPEAVEDDTMIAAYLLDSSRASYVLPLLAQQNLGADAAAAIPEGWTKRSIAPPNAPILRFS
jgi:DNA polymerase I-like protein with 3'-5' exonuclease and polymerase domains